MHTIYVPVLKVSLVAIDVSLLAFLVSLMLDHVSNGWDTSSYAFTFHCLTLCWLSIRGAFWLMSAISTTQWSSSMFYALYWLANPVEFGSFLLLPLFFSQVLYPTSWKRHWGVIRFAYISAIVGLVLFQGLWIFLAALEMNRGTLCDPADADSNATKSPPGTGGTDNNTLLKCFHSEYTSVAFRSITAACFLFLAVAQGAYGWKLAYVDPRLHQQYLVATPRIVAAVNAALVASFLSRGIYQLATIFGLYLLPDLPLMGSEDVAAINWLVFMLWYVECVVY
jgi:hypothetical protein